MRPVRDDLELVFCAYLVCKLQGNFSRPTKGNHEFCSVCIGKCLEYSNKVVQANLEYEGDAHWSGGEVL